MRTESLPPAGCSGGTAESAIVGVAVAGQSFDQFYTERYQPMVRLGALLVDSTERAEELAQDAFARAFQRWDRLDHPAAYVRRALVNACQSELRRRGVHRRRIVRLRPTLVTEDEPDELFDALQRLPPRQRAAVVLRFYQAMSEREIAAVLGCRPGTVKSLVHRGMAQLRREVTP